MMESLLAALRTYFPLLYHYWPIFVTMFLVMELTYRLYARFVVVSSGLPTEGRADNKNKTEKWQDEEEDVVQWEEDVVSNLHDKDIPHDLFAFIRRPEAEMVQRAHDFYTLMNSRRTIRFFSSDLIPHDVIRDIVRTAGTAPSGAHTEPWTFVVVSNHEMKEKIKEIVENEEEINYKKRMGRQWVADLQFVKTNCTKPYLTAAPVVLLVFRQTHRLTDEGKRITHYYNEISVSLCCGILLAAIQNAGLVTLTSTPLNCGPALRSVVQRPSHEKLVLLLPLGYPAETATVPRLYRKPLEDILVSFQ